MLSLQLCQRILLLIAILESAAVASELGQQFRYEHKNDYKHQFPLSSEANLMPTSKEYPPPSSWHQFQAYNSQLGDGNILAGAEIAMEILNGRHPVSVDIPNEFYAQRPQEQQQLPPKESFDFSKSRHNFRKSDTTPYADNAWQREMEGGKLFSKNYNWHKNANNDNDVTDADADTSGATLADDTFLQPEFYGIDKETYDIIAEIAKKADTTNIANDGDSDNINTQKRQPMVMDNRYEHLQQPYYPFAFLHPSGDASESKAFAKKFLKLRSSKRERMRPAGTPYLPSISAGAMSHLGAFFHDLSKNVRFNERHNLPESELKLLEGHHPLGILQDDTAEADEESKIGKTTQFLQAVRSYRPSQKIRSLVAMNPKGYHGSSFLDPNYMWVGLG